MRRASRFSVMPVDRKIRRPSGSEIRACQNRDPRRRWTDAILLQYCYKPKRKRPPQSATVRYNQPAKPPEMLSWVRIPPARPSPPHSGKHSRSGAFSWVALLQTCYKTGLKHDCARLRSSVRDCQRTRRIKARAMLRWRILRKQPSPSRLPAAFVFASMV